jgi:hypothetical protein
MKIPDYYRQFQTQPKTDDSKPASGQPEISPVEKTPQPKEEKTRDYNANEFKLKQLEDWSDSTIFTLTGPVSDGIQHNIIINIDRDVPFTIVQEYAEYQISTLEHELKGCTLLKKGDIKLASGTDAYEAVFSWYPSASMRIYQHQVYTMINKTAYKLTASFTKKTFKILGPSVLRMMLSIEPFEK